MLKAEGSVLVDDYVNNLVEWQEAGGYGVRFDLDMDGKGFPVIDRLDLLIDLLDQLCQLLSNFTIIIEILNTICYDLYKVGTSVLPNI